MGIKVDYLVPSYCLHYIDSQGSPVSFYDMTHPASAAVVVAVL